MDTVLVILEIAVLLVVMLAYGRDRPVDSDW